MIGVPRAISGRATYWPSLAVDIAVGALFEQTPGPQAGSRIAS